jgi:hypothetical protein
MKSKRQNKMKNQDWKLKYSDLKLKFHDAVDCAFRLGMEQGLQQGQMQAQQQQQADAQQQQAAMMGQQPGQDPNDPNAQPGQEQSDGSELDQHIGQLESMLQGSQPGSSEQEGLQKSLAGIKAFQSSLKQSYDLRKSEKTIAAIGKSMKPTFTLSKAATKNLSEHGKKALSMQEQIVDELMKSMAEEEKKATEAITKTLNFEQLLKG